MKTSTIHRLSLRPALTTSFAVTLLLSACLDDQPASFSNVAGSSGHQAEAGGATLPDPSGGASAGTGGGPDNAGGSKAGSSGAPTHAGEATLGGDGPSAPEGGASGEDPVLVEGGAGGAKEEGVHISHTCIFHTDASPPDVGAAGAGGEGPAPSVTAPLSPFVGSYLADEAGRTLYTYGADFAGDCQTPPKSTCTADCLVSWPIFDAGPRLLGPGLADAGFGEIQREDGLFQTTYMGWPLYYYKTDLVLGQFNGQEKGKIWHIAEVSPPSIVIMKVGMLKYLADVAGYTLYVSANDQVGTADADPISHCTGSCLQTFEGFHEKNFSSVTALEPLDFQVFAGGAGDGLQLAYKGLPLYRAATDLKSGDMNGTAVAGFTAALP